MSKYCVFLALWFAIVTIQAQTPPVIVNSSETAGGGDVIFLQGSGFGSSPSVEYSHGYANWNYLTPSNSGEGFVSVQIPATDTQLPDLLTVRISPDNLNWSKAVFLNRARGTSLDTDEIIPGGSFRIFGRNLFFGKTPTVRFVDHADGSSSNAVVNVSSSYFYLLSVIAPLSVTAGHQYEIYVSNGYSGNSSSGDETLVSQTVVGRNGGADYWKLGVQWAADLTSFSNTYNVGTDHRLAVHALGDGSTDDTGAIASAVLLAGRAGGGVVYLPAGTYKLAFHSGCGVNLPDNVVLMGAGQSLTTINYGYGTPPDPGAGGYAVCFGNQTGVSDLRLNNVNESGRWPQSGLSIGNHELFLQRVTWNIGTSQWITMSRAHHLTIQQSAISQGLNTNYSTGTLALQGCSQCELRGNTIKFAVGGMAFDNSIDFIFEENSVVRDISVAPPPQSVTHCLAANFVTNLTLLNNTFVSQGSGLPTNNDGEVINSEGGGPFRFDEFRGTVSASDSISISDYGQNFNRSGNVVPGLRAGLANIAIVSGRGLGQVRLVKAVSPDGRTITVDRPWDVMVDSGSHYATFDWSASGWIVANNAMTGNFKGIELFDASASDILIQSNNLTNSGGIMVSPSQNPPGLFNVVRGLNIVSNVVADTLGLRPAFVGIMPREDSQTTSFGTAVIGALVKGNTVKAFTSNVSVKNPSWDDYKVISEGYLNYWCWQSESAFSVLNAPPPILGTIFQYDEAQDSRTAFVLNTGASDTVIQDYIPVNIGQTLLDQSITGASRASQNTALHGISTFVPSLIGVSPFTASQAGSGSYLPETPMPQPFVLDTGKALKFVPVTPCRVADTRDPDGPFGGPELGAASTRNFLIPNSACDIPSRAAAYSLNVTVVPDGVLGFLAIWPSGSPQPLVSTLNSDSRVKANAAIVPAGTGDGVAVYVSHASHVILDINGYFAADDGTGLAFYPLTPCRAADTRNAPGPLGQPYLQASSPRTFPLLSSSCGIPSTAQAYFLNFTVVPRGPSVGVLSAWPAGQPQPLVSTLNDFEGTVVANAAIVQAGTGGDISVYSSDPSEVIIDVNGYFAPPQAGGLSFYMTTPCRVLDTRNGDGALLNGTTTQSMFGLSQCLVPTQAQAFVLNSTVVPEPELGVLTLWPSGSARTLVSTLNAFDGAVTSNMSIVPGTNGTVNAYTSNPAHLILDMSGYFAPEN